MMKISDLWYELTGMIEGAEFYNQNGNGLGYKVLRVYPHWVCILTGCVSWINPPLFDKRKYSLVTMALLNSMQISLSFFKSPICSLNITSVLENLYPR